jgi:putative PIN family toxin of toxin-antitoxin system
VKIVLDTNVVVAGLLSPGRKPADVLELVDRGVVLVCYSDSILAEYRDVLMRPKFAGRINPARAHALADVVRAQGVRIAEPVPAAPYALPDPDDQPFLDVAVASAADAIVTGNGRHFPSTCGRVVLTPAALLALVRINP